MFKFEAENGLKTEAKAAFDTFRIEFRNPKSRTWTLTYKYKPFPILWIHENSKQI